MKAGRSFKCLFWAVLYCVLYLVSASDEDLVDFDFTDLKEIDWNYEQENDGVGTDNVADKKFQATGMSLFDDELEENQVRPFDWRENVLRIALSKALTNAALRQKFVEVMPILRVLSSQQRLALSALISAQIGAKKGQELKLEQVRMMFGDDKKLLLPIVYDIANLVRNSARKYLNFEYDVAPVAVSKQKPSTPIGRRDFELSLAEAKAEEQTKDIGTINVSHVDGQADSKKANNEDDSSLEDFFAEMQEDLLDPQSINEELQGAATKESYKPAIKSKPTNATTSNTTATTTVKRAVKRQRRAAATTDFVHKLIRSVPLSVNEDDLRRGAAGNTIKLNTTAFLLATESAQSTTDIPASPYPSAASYQDVEDLAFASLNGTEFELNESDVTGLHNSNSSLSEDEPLPNPEELIAGPRYRIHGNKLQLMRSGSKLPAKRKRVQLRPRPKGPPAPAERVTAAASSVVPKKCERFTASMCIRTDDYPLDQIMGSIRRHKNAMTALLAEYHDKPAHIEYSDDPEDFNFKRREDDGTGGGGMCQSIVRYARPQKARSATGDWKYIVNTGQHTQTLRLEKCTNPQESCSYLAHNYRSHCTQVYNYHRLLSWDKTRGLHVDIFKVPTCCSCQIDGYRQQFPPLSSIKAKDYTPAQAVDTYSTINEELDYNDEEDEDDLSFQYSNGFKHRKPHSGEANELLLGASKHIHSKAYAPNPTLGSYLSPPGSDEYDREYPYHRPQSAAPSSTSILGAHSLHRRPYKSLASAVNEARVDLDLAPSETHTEKEVKLNIFGIQHAGESNHKAHVPHTKRKRIYSVPHTATTRGSSSSAATSAGTTYASTVTSAAPAAAAAAPVAPAHAIRAGGGGAGGGGGGGGVTSITHKASAARPTNHYASHGESSLGGGGTKPKARLHASLTTAAPAHATATPPTTAASSTHTYYARAPAAVSPNYHVNSIYSARYNATVGGGVAAGTRRINYSYHPIIDFFENNRRSAAAAAVPSSSSSSPSSAQAEEEEQAENSASRELAMFPHKIPKTDTGAGLGLYHTRERRIGYGAGGIDYNSAGVEEDNAWHPVVVQEETRALQ